MPLDPEDKEVFEALKAVQQAGSKLDPEDQDLFNALAENDEGPGLLRRGYDALNAPARASERGLNELADLVPHPEPTGNLPLDIAKGAPSILAESGLRSLGKVAPTFIDAPSILTAGASAGLKSAMKVPAVKQAAVGAGKFVTRNLGKLSGATGEALDDAATKGMEAFKGSRKEAGEAVETAAKNSDKTAHVMDGPVDKTVLRIKNPMRFVTRAEQLAEEGRLTPEQALRARQEVDNLFGSSRITMEEQKRLRKVFDGIAKADAGIQKADAAFPKALKAERLRNVLPINAKGEPRVFLGGLGLGAAPFLGPKALLAAPFFSPAAQGLIAVLAGAAGRASVKPGVATGTQALARVLAGQGKSDDGR